MKRPHFSFPVLALLSMGLISTLRADTAFFTKDASEIVFTPTYQSGLLWRLNLKSAKPVPIVLGGPLKGKEAGNIVQGAEGEILLTADNAVWVLGKDGQPRKIADEKEPESFFSGPAAEGPLKDWLFTVRGEGEGDAGLRSIFYARKPGARTFRSVFCRRINNVGTAVFTSGGRFFFAGQGDLWEGGFDNSDDDGTGHIATLIGCRIAPLAVLNTDMANAGSQTVREIHMAGNTLFIGLAGRHMGSILRLPVPAKTAYGPGPESETPDPGAALELQRQSLTEVQIIVPETGGLSAMAAAEIDGKPAVFYRGESDEQGMGLWLWTAGGGVKRLANEPRE
ncbi:MAG: hypothetical protein JWM59_2693 [Verrucomicrobiales bacterium]|nr:hypothetical protein [Verrucomicrobiales bacterium]